jgi:hypothetical protein
MGRWICTSIFVFSLVLAGGCKKQAGDQDAIRASIDKHLSGRSDLNMAGMEHEVKQVSIDRDQATAQVEFRLKQGGATMQVDYTLQRRDGEWTVLKSQPAGGQFSHPAMDQPPPNAPGSTQTTLPSFSEILKNQPASGSDSLPPDHPPVSGNSSSGSESGGNKPPSSSY